jgi:hypothetical protein
MFAATHHEIAACAYCIWLQEGKPEGRALDHWLQAELHLVLSSILRPQEQRNPPANEGGRRGATLPVAARQDIGATQPSKRWIPADLIV